MNPLKKSLATAMIMAAYNKAGPAVAPPVMLPSRTTARNPEQQRLAYEAAELKRQRKQMKRLADLGQTGEELL